MNLNYVYYVGHLLNLQCHIHMFSYHSRFVIPAFCRHHCIQSYFSPLTTFIKFCFSTAYMLKHAQHCNLMPQGTTQTKKKVPNFFSGGEQRKLIWKFECSVSSPKLSRLLLFAAVRLCKVLVCGLSREVKKNNLLERFPIILTSGQVRYTIRSDP